MGYIIISVGCSAFLVVPLWHQPECRSSLCNLQRFKPSLNEVSCCLIPAGLGSDLKIKKEKCSLFLPVPVADPDLHEMKYLGVSSLQALVLIILK